MRSLTIPRRVAPIPSRRSALPLLGLLALALAIRVIPVWRGELWSDEIFSLAMATGHSLEQAPAVADPSLGDYIEPTDAQDRSYFARYVAHDRPPAGVWRIVRAVFLSDTNPPFYYVLLGAWTRVLGTSDAALRAFSMLWAVLTIPLLWRVAGELGGPVGAWLAAILFTCSPMSIYYSSEGRMYSFLWFLGTLLGWLTLALARRGARVPLLVGWIATAAIGLLSHYFFAFVWIACALWLGRAPGRLTRAWVGLLNLLVVLAVLPWFAQVPANLRLWRVSAGWLDGLLSWERVLSAPWRLGVKLVVGERVPGEPHLVWPVVVIAGIGVLLAAALGRNAGYRRLFARECSLVWLWLIGACVGPVFFDLVLRTHAAEIPRYALAGLPAAILLLSTALAQVGGWLRTLLVAVILIAWLPGIVTANAPRPWVAFRAMARSLDGWAGPSDLIIVHSIPSAVIALSRYLRGSARMTSSMVLLSTGGAPDLPSLVQGRGKVALVRAHDLGRPVPAEAWLLEHARLQREEAHGVGGRVLYFAPREGRTPGGPSPPASPP